MKIKRYCRRYSFRQKGEHNASMSLIHMDLLLDASLREPTYHLWQRMCWWWHGDPGGRCGWRWSPWCPAPLSGRTTGPDWCIISWRSLSIKTATLIDYKFKINHRCIKIQHRLFRLYQVYTHFCLLLIYKKFAKMSHLFMFLQTFSNVRCFFKNSIFC